jgi:hypothetical protein
MGSGNIEGGSKAPLVIAGIESGVLGGVFMLAWLALLSLLQGRSVWSIPNLLASTFYGDAALSRGFRWSTVSGLALHLLMSAAAGLLFALLAGGMASRKRVMLLGVGAGAAWYFLSLDFFWKHINPMVPLYASGAGPFIGHLGLGIFLGSVPKFRDELDAPVPAAEPVGGD